MAYFQTPGSTNILRCYDISFLPRTLYKCSLTNCSVRIVEYHLPNFFVLVVPFSLIFLPLRTGDTPPAPSYSDSSMETIVSGVTPSTGKKSGKMTFPLEVPQTREKTFSDFFPLGL